MRTLLMSAIWLFAAVAFAEPALVQKVGFAERDITPEIGMEQPGGYGKARSRAIHDPCKVRASVFDDGESRVAIVSLDTLAIRADTVKSVREKIEAACGIKPTAVMIAASHSHSAGPLIGALPGEFDDSDPLVKKLVYEQSTNADPDYVARVEQAIVEAVCEANEKRAAARLGFGFGHEDSAIFNRRFRMKSGFANTHPGVGNPDIVEPAGPIDPQVGVVGVFTPEGDLSGCIVNFACHATCGSTGISADWIYYLEQTIRGVFGNQAIVVFATGAGGDVTQVDNRRKFEFPQFGPRSARFVGGRIGAEAVKTLLSMHGGGETGPVASVSRMLTIKRRIPKPERVAAARSLIESKPDGGDTDWTFAKEIVVLDAVLKKQPTAEIEVQAIQLGPAVFLACPAEYFCQFALDLKKQSNFPFTFPVAYANGSCGYVPTEEALGPRGGGYETRLTAYSNLEPTAGTQFVSALIEMAKAMEPGPVPQLPPAPKFNGQPWTYGNLPPELE